MLKDLKWEQQALKPSWWRRMFQKTPTAPVNLKEEWQLVLLGTADYLDKHGWVQGRAIPEAEIRLCGHIGDSFLTTWNDKLGRTKEQVTTALRACALKP